MYIHIYIIIVIIVIINNNNNSFLSIINRFMVSLNCEKIYRGI